ncbi:hypothetical protein [Desulfogranum japonicum]|uniref:hypothetical protein n=1 Tax=Desulfogranum japonicum TaxID=231447 RepID=UPI00129485F3|nr:hypothetical protein [Desulfogranum japonicum]
MTATIFGDCPAAGGNHMIIDVEIVINLFRDVAAREFVLSRLMYSLSQISKAYTIKVVFEKEEVKG